MSRVSYNRLANCHNRYQGEFKRVLCVCSAGLLRSPTTALVLSQEPYNFNTRACGIDEDHALIPIDEVLLDWAAEIVCMNARQKERIEFMLKKAQLNTPVINLEIEDRFAYRDPELIKSIKESYDKAQSLGNAKTEQEST